MHSILIFRNPLYSFFFRTNALLLLNRSIQKFSPNDLKLGLDFLGSFFGDDHEVEPPGKKEQKLIEE